MNIKGLLVFSMLSTASISAQAVVIDFAGMANGATGESIWTSLNLSYADFDVSITGSKNGNDAFAYLDRNTGGLGVCGDPNSTGSSKLNMATNSGTNLCAPGNDDNMTTGEILHFVFNTDVTIDTIWFNNFHDGDRNLNGDTIDIGGAAYTFGNGNSSTPSYTTSSYLVSAGTDFDIAYNNEQFYVQMMDVSKTTVPEPASFALMGLGLIGLAGLRRRRNK